MKVVSLELDKSDREQETVEAKEMERPLYPYGTSLYLDEKALAKLGITEMPDVGTVVLIQAVAKVTGTSEREYEGGSHKTLDVQITEMGLEEGEEAPEPEEKQSFEGAAKTLYGGKKG